MMPHRKKENTEEDLKSNRKNEGTIDT